MAYSNVIEVVKTTLDYKTRGWKIQESQKIHDNSYNRNWYFNCEELTIIPTLTDTDLCLFLDGTMSNNKIGIYGNVTGNSLNWQFRGNGVVANVQSTNYGYRNDWYGATNYTFNCRNYSSYVLEQAVYTSNIPIFENVTQAQGYINGTVPISDALNYLAPEIEPDGEPFEITNPWTHGTWTAYGHTESGDTNYRCVRGKIVSGTMALYPIEFTSGATALKYGITFSDDIEFYGLEYSEDNIVWHSTYIFPYEYFYRPRINELGTFDYGLSLGGMIPIFEDENTADGYNDGTVDISDAINWNIISGDYPSNNGTGLEESSTTFGEVYTRSMFSQLYLCNVGALLEISNALFDYDVTTLSGLWEDIKKGLEMYGTNPMDVVQGLRYYPVDLSTIFTNTSNQQYIYFGAYQLNMENSVKHVVFANGYLDLGSIVIKRSFNDWRDFEPYTKISIYLPYVGSFPLDAKKYYDKTVNIRYYIDLRTGSCTACLIANNVLLDWFDGIIGTDMPITLTDYAGYAQSQLNIIMRNAGLGIASEATAGNLATKVMKSAITYNENAQAIQEAAQMSPLKSSLAAQTAGSYGVQAIGAAAVGSTALLGGVAVGTAMKTSFDLMRSGTAAHTKTKPASSAMINQYLPQYVYLRFEILEIDESPYLNTLYGRPTNASGRIGDFSGYLECEDVSLICPIATDNERQEIIDLLKTGIYITPP